jgi:hypothetical protein
MSRLDAAKGLGESLRSRIVSTQLLTSACSFAQRLQASLEGLGAASNIILLSGVGANFVASYLSGLTMKAGPPSVSADASPLKASGLAESTPTKADSP